MERCQWGWEKLKSQSYTRVHQIAPLYKWVLHTEIDIQFTFTHLFTFSLPNPNIWIWFIYMFQLYIICEMYLQLIQYMCAGCLPENRNDNSGLCRDFFPNFTRGGEGAVCYQISYQKYWLQFFSNSFFCIGQIGIYMYIKITNNGSFPQKPGLARIFFGILHCWD